MNNIVFQDPFWFLLLIPLLFFFWLKERPKYRGFLFFPSTKIFSEINNPWLSILYYLPTFLRLSCFILIIVGLARPQKIQTIEPSSEEALDIMLVIDTSGSMKALDFVDDNNERKDRLSVAKKVISRFIHERKNDRIGLVVFGGQAFTQSPLTFDHTVLQLFLEKISIGMAGEETAIGDALTLSTKGLKSIQAKSKIIILLTDGKNTAGSIDPELATQAAKTFNVKVYTIGIGSKGKVPFPLDTPFGSRIVYQELEMDTEILKKIAAATDGKFFEAKDLNELTEVYQTIDQLEKTEHEKKTYVKKEELFHWFFIPALILFVLEVLLQLTPWRRMI